MVETSKSTTAPASPLDLCPTIEDFSRICHADCIALYVTWVMVSVYVRDSILSLHEVDLMNLKSLRQNAATKPVLTK